MRKPIDREHRLTNRQRRILEHVDRNSMSTNEIVQSKYFDEQHPSAVTRTTSALTKLGWLNAFPLIYPTKYFRLGKRSATAFGLSPNATYPLGPQALPTQYAILRYAMSHPHRKRLSGDELVKDYPFFASEWSRAIYCEQVIDGKTLLQVVRVDLGGAVDELARKCTAEIEKRWCEPEFREFVGEGRFQIVVLTATTEKSARIQSALKRRQWPAGLQIRLGVFPELLPLLPGTF